MWGSEVREKVGGLSVLYLSVVVLCPLGAVLDRLVQAAATECGHTSRLTLCANEDSHLDVLSVAVPHCLAG